MGEGGGSAGVHSRRRIPIRGATRLPHPHPPDQLTRHEYPVTSLSPLVSAAENLDDDDHAVFLRYLGQQVVLGGQYESNSVEHVTRAAAGGTAVMGDGEGGAGGGG